MDNKIIEWDDKYSVGIRMLDEQHRDLVKITNDLYMGCLQGGDAANDNFIKTVHNVVNYTQYHFSAEEQMLEKIRYPDLVHHKRQHEEFVREILSQVKNFEEGKPLVPSVFVRYLRDWILAHIAFIDKKYATYLQVLKTQGYARTRSQASRDSYHFLEQYLKPDYLPPPEIFWG